VSGPRTAGRALPARVDHAVTGALCLEAVLFDAPAGVHVALVIAAVAAAAPRRSPGALLTRLIAPGAGTGADGEGDRRGRLLELVPLALAAVLLLAGARTAGLAVAGLVAVLALCAAVLGVGAGDVLGRRRTPPAG
jgi:hypothetical protein